MHNKVNWCEKCFDERWKIKNNQQILLLPNICGEMCLLVKCFYFDHFNCNELIKIGATKKCSREHFFFVCWMREKNFIHYCVWFDIFLYYFFFGHVVCNSIQFNWIFFFEPILSSFIQWCVDTNFRERKKIK